MTASRRELLLGCAERLAMAAPALALGVLPGGALAAEPSDADQLDSLLGLERRLAAAYESALARDAIEPALGRLLLGHERAHIRGLEQALGHARPRATAPAPKVGIDFASRSAFARSALQLEREAVDRYQDVLTGFHNDKLLQPLGSIMACGVQHEVALREVLGEHLL